MRLSSFLASFARTGWVPDTIPLRMLAAAGLPTVDSGWRASHHLRRLHFWCRASTNDQLMELAPDKRAAEGTEFRCALPSLVALSGFSRTHVDAVDA